MLPVPSSEGESDEVEAESGAGGVDGGSEGSEVGICVIRGDGVGGVGHKMPVSVHSCASLEETLGVYAGPLFGLECIGVDGTVGP